MEGSGRGVDALIRALRPCTVAVIGDVMLDRYVGGQVRRLSPEAPVQVLEATDESTLPGGAANVAMKVVGLDSRAHLVGLVGEDDAAEELRELLAARDEMVDGLVGSPAHATTVKTRFIASNQQLLRVDRERRDPPVGWTLDHLARAAYEAASKADAVILEDYGKGVLTPEVIRAALEGAKVRNAPVVVDPNGRDYRRYAGATVLTPNVREAELAAEMPIRNADELAQAGQVLVEQTEGAALAITRDREGISLFRPAEGGGVAHDHIPTVPVAVFDVTGAGDAVAAALAIALASGLDLADACTVANLAGRAVVRQFGVGTISVGHLMEEAAETTQRSAKVVGVDIAKRRVAEVHRRGEKVVFTNGCFDILHYGHAFLLQHARSCGDYLILGLNTDASVRRQKGDERPYVDEDQRAYMLSLYPFVDLIVLFDDDTPLNLIEALRPDVLVKGGDYTPETVVGRDQVESWGGHVAICPRLEGLSTTDIVRKIQDARGRNPGGVAA